VVIAASIVELVSVKVEVAGLVVIPPLKASISSILSLTVLKDQSDFKLCVRLYLAHGENSDRVRRGVGIRTSDHDARSPANAL